MFQSVPRSQTSYFILNTSKVSQICVLCICEYTYHIIQLVYKHIYIYKYYSLILFKLLFPSFWQSYQCEFFSCQSRDSRPAAGSARDVCSVLLAKLPLISSWCEKIRVSWTWLAMGRAARKLLYYQDGCWYNFVNMQFVRQWYHLCSFVLSNIFLLPKFTWRTQHSTNKS